MLFFEKRVAIVGLCLNNERLADCTVLKDFEHCSTYVHEQVKLCQLLRGARVRVFCASACVRVCVISRACFNVSQTCVDRRQLLEQPHVSDLLTSRKCVLCFLCGSSLSPIGPEFR